MPSPSVEFDPPASSAAPGPSGLPSASTNPLSLSPDEVYQYRVAGLELDQELPSKSVPGFPHRCLPPSFPLAARIDIAVQTDGEESEVEAGHFRAERRAPHLRMQHLGVLTTILHRCLLEGDIPRAGRAWAMLLRAQINGEGIDTRSSGYWGIGAELLIRGDKTPARGRRVLGKDDSESLESSVEDNKEDEEAEPMKVENHEESERQWGSASGLEKAKDYYERLILQHPYKRQYHDSVNSLDFWPAMLGCEIYGIQFEQDEGLRKVAAEVESDDVAITDNSESEDENMVMDDTGTYFAAHQLKETRRRERKRETIWKRREEIRQTALIASEKVAAKMDRLMATPPFSDSHVLQRLRGMLALYIGDLSVPALPASDEEDEAEDYDNESADGTGIRMGNRWASASKEVAEKRFLEHLRRAEHERGLVRQAEERARARKAFEKAQKDGGRVDVELNRLLLSMEDFETQDLD